MTPKQKAFADYYIKTGNATEAAKLAGYKGNEKTLGEVGHENLKKPVITEYISKIVRDTEENRIADAREVMEFFTDVMRGKVKDQFGLESSLSDRINAGKELMKRHDAGRTLPGSKKREEDPVTRALREMAERIDHGDF